MKSEMKSSDGLIREIAVEIPAEEVTAAFDEKYAYYKKKAKIPGFRPGKVTKEVLKQKYYEAIKEEIVQDLVQKTYPQVIKEHDLKVASMPDFPELELKEGDPMTYTVKVEVVPEIEEINFDNLQLPKQELEITDKEVDAVVEYMRKKSAEFKKVDREVQKEDAVLVDMEKVGDPDNVLKESKFENTSIDMDSEYTMNVFREGLLGLKAGDIKEITIDYPEEFANEVLAGHTIVYKIFVKEVKERVLPIADDRFAKAQGDCETLLELRLKIREDLSQQKKHEQRQWQRQELQRQVVDHNEIPLPQGMIDQYLEEAYKNFSRQNPELEKDTFREQMRPMAEHSLRWEFLSDHIARAEKITVLPSDTENWIKGFAESQKITPEQAKDALAKRGQIEEIRNRVREEKLFDYLMTKVTFVDAPKPSVTGEQADEAAADRDSEENKTTEEK